MLAANELAECRGPIRKTTRTIRKTAVLSGYPVVNMTIGKRNKQRNNQSI
jgi:hypothetical protein|tara:strand:+ start:464 stop:613 length:150 start_codon:yes stop_codon:yes gene_type:complete